MYFELMNSPTEARSLYQKELDKDPNNPFMLKRMVSGLPLACRLCGSRLQGPWIAACGRPLHHLAASCASAWRCGKPCFASHARMLNVCSGLFHSCGQCCPRVARVPQAARTGERKTGLGLTSLTHCHAQLSSLQSRCTGGAQARAGRPCRSSGAAEAIPLSTGGPWEQGLCLRCWICAAARRYLASHVSCGPSLHVKAAAAAAAGC